MVAATPAYLGSDFSDAPPGHRFGLYYAGWDQNFGQIKDGKTDALKAVCSFPSHSQKLLAALIARQKLHAETSPDTLLALPLVASSPFATGLGNEHPLENGFSFLTPYGLPYLPGSGVKGVIRRAAEELAGGDWGDTHDWNDVAILALFGPGEEDFARDRDTNPQQGALRFWDVLPQTPKHSMSVEIMTPHLGDYYQGKDDGKVTPKTSLTPNPIPFLAVPPATTFLFHVECNPARIDSAYLLKNWKPLIEAAFVHAGKWLGFGAKTAVGYGRMEPDDKAMAAQREQQEKAAAIVRKEAQAQEQEKQLAALSPLDRSVQEAINSRPQGQPELTALFNAFKAGRWQGDDARTVAGRLQTQMKQENRWRENSEKKKPEKDEPYQMTLTVLAALRAPGA
ncbi:MAG: type III-B CRISPR module RAMP protein Cmr6 [Sulfuritalea sp.]|nr:type III-B CRISPR module RAMP protein Cmr6 [Sulfuritalea sp.]